MTAPPATNTPDPVLQAVVVTMEEGNTISKPAGTMVHQQPIAATDDAATSGKAIASLVTGILSLFIFGVCLGPVAIFLGIQAKQDIGRYGGQRRGNCQAVGGIVTGSIGLVFGILLLAAFLLAALGFAIGEDAGAGGGSSWIYYDTDDDIVEQFRNLDPNR